MERCCNSAGRAAAPVAAGSQAAAIAVDTAAEVEEVEVEVDTMAADREAEVDSIVPPQSWCILLKPGRGKKQK